MEEDDPKFFEIRSRLTAEQKWNNAVTMYWAARELKAAGFRTLHPQWSEEQVQAEVRYVFLTSRG